MPEESPAASGPADAQPQVDGDESEPGGLGAEATPELLPAREPFRSLMRWLGLAEQGAGIFLLVVILILVLWQIIQRWLPSGFAWTGEIARFGMVWATFVMAGYLLAHDAHIAIKVVDLVLPVRVLGAVKLLGHLMITVVCAVMMYGVFDFMAHDRGQVTAAAEVPLTVIYTVVAFGFASTALRGVLAMLVIDLPEIRNGARAET